VLAGVFVEGDVGVAVGCFLLDDGGVQVRVGEGDEDEDECEDEDGCF